jgi:hypothetical protein
VDGIWLKGVAIMKDEERVLLDEWSAQRPEYKIFVRDGILNKSLYTASNPKIAILLKESNDDFVEIAPLTTDGYGPNGNSSHFWRNINIYTYIATCAWNNINPIYDDIHEITEKQVNSIAYINVKKNAENKSVSNDNEILEYSERDQPFLRKQLRIIQPQIVFCGNTKKCYDFIEDSSFLKHNVYLGKNRLVIDYYHPSYAFGFEKHVEILSTCLFDSDVQRAIQEVKSAGY